MSVSPETRDAIQYIYDGLKPCLNEKQRRLFLALSAQALGRGGISAVSEMTGASRTTVESGISEINKDQADDVPTDTGRVRKEGGGRKPAKEKIPGLYDKIEDIVSATAYGSPTEILSWTTMGLRKIAAALKERYDIEVSQNIVSRALDSLGYSKRQNRKNLQAREPCPDRNGQFEFISHTAKAFIEQGEPVISVDTGKKELVGELINGGTEYRFQGGPRQAPDHGLHLEDLGKISPYGIYVLDPDTGFMNLGTDQDTAELATESVYLWWDRLGRYTFPNAKRIYITADIGGSDGFRARSWEYGLQELADRAGLEIHVSHFPSGTYKWNRAEHRLFCYISRSSQGDPSIDIETVVSLISSPATTKGPEVRCAADGNEYEFDRAVSEEEMDSVDPERRGTFGNWNYIIHPQV